MKLQLTRGIFLQIELANGLRAIGILKSNTFHCTKPLLTRGDFLQVGRAKNERVIWHPQKSNVSLSESVMDPVDVSAKLMCEWTYVHASTPSRMHTCPSLCALASPHVLRKYAYTCVSGFAKHVSARLVMPTPRKSLVWTLSCLTSSHGCLFCHCPPTRALSARGCEGMVPPCTQERDLGCNQLASAQLAGRDANALDYQASSGADEAGHKGETSGDKVFQLWTEANIVRRGRAAHCRICAALAPESLLHMSVHQTGAETQRTNQHSPSHSEQARVLLASCR